MTKRSHDEADGDGSSSAKRVRRAQPPERLFDPAIFAAIAAEVVDPKKPRDSGRALAGLRSIGGPVTSAYTTAQREMIPRLDRLGRMSDQLFNMVLARGNDKAIRWVDSDVPTRGNSASFPLHEGTSIKDEYGVPASVLLLDASIPLASHTQKSMLVNHICTISDRTTQADIMFDLRHRLRHDFDDGAKTKMLEAAADIVSTRTRAGGDVDEPSRRAMRVIAQIERTCGRESDLAARAEQLTAQMCRRRPHVEAAMNEARQEPYLGQRREPDDALVSPYIKRETDQRDRSDFDKEIAAVEKTLNKALAQSPRVGYQYKERYIADVAYAARPLDDLTRRLLTGFTSERDAKSAQPDKDAGEAKARDVERARDRSPSRAA